MNHSRLMLAAAAAALMLAACQPQSPAPAPTATASPTATPAADDGAALGEFRRTGTVTKVEDAGYPMFVVFFDFGDGKPPVSFLFNDAESTKPADTELSALVGKRVEVAYSRKPELHVSAVLLEGHDIMTRDPGEPGTPPGESVTGKLDGPTEISHGDLPDELTVTDAAGKVFTFPAFVIDQAVIDARGKTVTAYYTESTTELITSITLAP
jgi:hypothetical protein